MFLVSVPQFYNISDTILIINPLYRLVFSILFKLNSSIFCYFNYTLFISRLQQCVHDYTPVSYTHLWKNILFGQSFRLIYHNLLLRGLGTRCQIDSAGKNTDGGNHLLSYTIPHHMLPPPLTRSITLLPYSLMLLWLVKIYRHISAVDGIQYNYIRA